MEFKPVSAPSNIESKLDALLEPLPKPTSYFSILEKIMKPFKNVYGKFKGSTDKVHGVLGKMKDALVERKPVEISRLMVEKWKSWATAVFN
jgi:hypothetical protein